VNDPELFSHLMAEITGRFEDLATEAARLQAPGAGTPDATALLLRQSLSAHRLVEAAVCLTKTDGQDQSTSFS